MQQHVQVPSAEEHTIARMANFDLSLLPSRVFYMGLLRELEGVAQPDLKKHTCMLE